VTAESMIKLLKEALGSRELVQSFSGVRTSFGGGPDISDANRILAVAYGFAYSHQMLQGLREATFLLGRDPRPTGEALVAALAEGFQAGASAAGCHLCVLDMGIITTPILQTAVRVLKAAGGAMVTASHNPLKDNGFKFLTGVRAVRPNDAPAGALLSASAMADVVEKVKHIAYKQANDFIRFAGKQRNEQSRVEDPMERVKAERGYLDAVGRQWGIAPHCLKPLTLGPVLLDPNGGAACGIGARVLEHFGVRAIEENAEIGYPEHSIDTDGIDASSGRHTLLRVARAALRRHARFGIAFDYDADRGNIVLPGLDESAIIEPQTVAAMNIALALAHRKISGNVGGKVAVVVSDATSGMSERIARMFGSDIFMVETGEINVVTRMHQLRREGYDVPVGVEGANGGTVFGESTCRDGLNTAICAALSDENQSLAEQWIRTLAQNGLNASAEDPHRLPALLATIPRHFTRMLRVEGPDMPHGEIKARMEHHFTHSAWPELSGLYQSYQFANYEGTSYVEKRSGDETGGWRVELKADDGKAFIFARGSRTEAGVWRLIVDDPNFERGIRLLDAGISMMRAAVGSDLHLSE